MKLKPEPKAPHVLVSWCSRCGKRIDCPGLKGIKCKDCGAVHDRVAEKGDEC